MGLDRLCTQASAPRASRYIPSALFMRISSEPVHSRLFSLLIGPGRLGRRRHESTSALYAATRTSLSVVTATTHSPSATTEVGPSLHGNGDGAIVRQRSV